MKRLVSLFIFALMAICGAAMPAKPGFRQYTQPDGKTVVLELRGDEYGHFYVDASGRKFKRDSEGYFKELSEVDVRSISARANNKRRLMNSIREVEFTDMTHGTRHIPVFLVEFTDTKFTIEDPHENFDRLLNEEAYTGYKNGGATGSVRDFYIDNSHGAFDPIFDVYGPVELDNPLSYYGSNNDAKASDALYHACLKLDDEIDFSQYDYDNDDYVDMALFYYAGGSQAEGWPEDTIWPHQGYAYGEVSYHSFDGKYLSRYFCTAELKGSQNNPTMCSIGATCHEFGHSLGLPDFYDTDYEENGSAGGLYIFSAMCSGPYNDDQRTPPYFNAEERIILGWMSETDVEELQPGEKVLEIIDNNKAYKTASSVDGEYFLYEKRGGKKWDNPLPEGMVVYHVDKSESHYVGNMSAYYQWEYWTYYNSINAYGSHPCFYVVAPNDPDNLNYDFPARRYSELVFPGFFNITTYNSVDWEGQYGSVDIKNIRMDGDKVLFDVTKASTDVVVDGSVVDIDGTPLEDVVVTISSLSDETTAGRIRIMKEFKTYTEILTDASGTFSYTFPESPGTVSISVSKNGYAGQTRTFDLSKRYNKASFTMRRNGVDSNFTFFDESQTAYYFGNQGSKSAMIAEKCSPDTWGAYEGMAIKSISIFTYLDAGAYYLVLDSSEGVKYLELDNVTSGDYTTVDLSDKEFIVPTGEFHIGYAIKNATLDENRYPLVAMEGGSVGYSNFNLESPYWQDVPGYDAMMTLVLEDINYVPDLCNMGYSKIDLGETELKAGNKLSVKLVPGNMLSVSSVLWYLDGKKSSSTFTLTAGWHTMKAIVQYSDDSKEILETEFEVK